MLTLTGTIRATAVIGGGTKKATGEIIPKRSVIQLETTDSRGLIQMHQLTVPDLSPFEGKIGESISLPVRAWAPGTTVNFMFEGKS